MLCLCDYFCVYLEGHGIFLIRRVSRSLFSKSEVLGDEGAWMGPQATTLSEGKKQWLAHIYRAQHMPAALSVGLKGLSYVSAVF